MIRRLERLPLDAPDIQSLVPLLNTRLLPTLTGAHPHDLSFGHSERWVYSIENKPVGLLIVSVIPDFKTGVLEWLFVEETHRNQGIASQLLNEAYSYLKNLGILALTLYYPKNVSFSPMIESLLKKFHSTPSRPMVRKFKFDVPNFNPPWLWRDIPPPPEYSFFPWEDLTVPEKRQLEHRFDQMQIPSSLSPFVNTELIDLTTSLGIRNKERVVGWCVNRWVESDNLEFTSLYIDPELAVSGLGFTALVQSIRLLKKDPPHWATVIYRLQADPVPAWANFVNKRLAVLSVETIDIYECSIIL